MGITLKVMAGDQLNIFGRSYWINSGGNFNDKFPIPVTGLLDAFLGIPAMTGKGLATATLNTTAFADAENTCLQRTVNSADCDPGVPGDVDPTLKLVKNTKQRALYWLSKISILLDTSSFFSAQGFSF